MPGTGQAARAAGMVERLLADGVGAAIRESGALEAALRSGAGTVFLLAADGLELAPALRDIHAAGKLACVHLDLVSGVRPDLAGVRWLRHAGADGLITARGQLVAASRAEGMVAIQRLLVIDEISLGAGLSAVERAGPDIVEVLPGVLLPRIASRLRESGVGPLLAGGFIRTAGDVARVRAAGAIAITTSTQSLWP